MGSLTVRIFPDASGAGGKNVLTCGQLGNARIYMLNARKTCDGVFDQCRKGCRIFDEGGSLINCKWD